MSHGGANNDNLSTAKITMKNQPTQSGGAVPAVGSDGLFGVPYLVENLREWASEFRANQHPVTLTLFRAIQTLEKMDAAMAKDDREIVRLASGSPLQISTKDQTCI